MGDVGTAASGEQLGACFGLRQVPNCIRIEKTDIAVTRIRCDWENNGLTAPIPVDDAFLVTVQLRDCARHDLWIDGRSRPTGPLHRGSISIYDLRTSPVVNSISPFSNLHFYIPRATMNAIAAREGCGEVDELPNEPGLGMDDPIVAGLGMSLESVFDEPATVATIFIDHITSALAARLARIRGAHAPRATRPDVALSSAHEKSVKEMIGADLAGNITTADLAEACGMSITEFRSAFVRKTGTMPHQWLMARRVDRARDLLRNTTLPLEAVACRSAFADVRQMRRVFMVYLGTRPEAIRAA
jgi:AraC-like DNA-binding protein